MTQIQKHFINHQPVWTGYLTKRNGQSQSVPQKFVIRPLTPDNIAEMGTLSAAIYQALKQDESCYIHKHEPAYYHQIFANKNMHYIGVFVDSRLIGMSYLNLCHTQQQFSDEIPGSPVHFFEPGKKTPVATFGADCVHPEFRGNALNQLMIAYRIELAKHLSCHYAASIIDRNNHWNMTPYFNNNFKMYATSIDPSDGGKIALMSHALKSEDPPKPVLGISVPYHRFETIDKLLALGFVGRMYDKQKESIVLTPDCQKIVHASYARQSLFLRSQQQGLQYV